MEKKEKDFEQRLKSFIIPILRRASLRWYARSEVLKSARKERGLYECSTCKSLVRNKEFIVDHIDPVVSMKDGYKDYETFIRRLFVEPDKLQLLCHHCSDMKTALEDSTRAMFNQKRKDEEKPKKKLDKKSHKE